MDPIPQEQLDKRFQALPETLQDAIFSDETAGAIGKSCQLRDVSEEAMSIIGALTGRVLSGYLRLESFAAEIQKETGVSEMTAQLVAHDIDGEIFSNVRLELKKLYPPIIQTPTVQTPWSNRTQAPEKFQDSSFKIQEKPKYVIPIPEKFMKREAWSVKPETQNQDLRIEEPVIQKQTQQTIQNTETQNQKQADQYSEVRPPTTNNLPPHQPQKATNNAVIGGIQMAEVEPQKPAVGGLTSTEPPQLSQIPQKPEEKNTLPANSENLQPTTYNLQASFKPIVPLPTFIRSQFKMEEPPKIGSRNNESGIRNEEEKQKEAKEFASKFGAPDPTLAKPATGKDDQYREKI